MAKSREKINQQLGFWDTEVSEPSHDTICLWAYKNAETIFRTVCPEAFNRLNWNNCDVLRGYGRHEQRFVDWANDFIKANRCPDSRVRKKTIEYVLSKQTGYGNRYEKNVGYADLLIETEEPCVVVSDDDRRVELCWTTVGAARILVEAKSVMPTVGELMRQINLYRTAFSGPFVVVSPDDTFADILNEQDVTFIKYAQ